jgi:Co/Zn/Cd efflux system component
VLIAPSVKRTGHILLQSPPSGIDVDDIKHDLEKVSPHSYSVSKDDSRN